MGISDNQSSRWQKLAELGDDDSTLVFAIGIKLPDNVPVQCPHDADARKHRRAAEFHDKQQAFHRRLPLRGRDTYGGG